MFLVLSLAPVSLTRFSPPVIERTDRLSFRELWRQSELGLSGAMTSGVVLGAFGTVGPVYAYEMGLPVEAIAAFMGTTILAAMFLQWPIGYISDRLPRRLVIIGVVGMAAVAALVTAGYAQRSPAALYVGVAVFYGFAACIYPLSLALTHDVLDKPKTVPASSTLLLANGIGAVAGPILGGGAITMFGPSGLMLLFVVALGTLAALSLHSLQRERAPKVSAQSHCTGVAPLSTATVLQMDTDEPVR